MDVKEIDAETAHKHLADGTATFVDVRDPGSFESAHIPGALAVTDETVEQFVRDSDKSRTLIIYCYHGNSSMGGAAYFQDQGFKDVYSLTGGFEDWRQQYPTE